MKKTIEIDKELDEESKKIWGVSFKKLLKDALKEKHPEDDFSIKVKDTKQR
jgi:hypothetical protein